MNNLEMQVLDLNAVLMNNQSLPAGQPFFLAHLKTLFICQCLIRLAVDLISFRTLKKDNAMIN